MEMNNKGSEAKKRVDRKKRCFLLLEPKKSYDSGEIAKKLARCRGVREVHLTSGRYGFVVSADADSSDEIKRICAALMKVAKSRSIGVAMSHFVYR